MLDGWMHCNLIVALPSSCDSFSPMVFTNAFTKLSCSVRETLRREMFRRFPSLSSWTHSLTDTFPHKVAAPEPAMNAGAGSHAPLEHVDQAAACAGAPPPPAP